MVSFPDSMSSQWSHSQTQCHVSGLIPRLKLNVTFMSAYFHRPQRHHWNGSKECSPSHCTHTPPASPLYRCTAHCPTRSDQLPPQTEQNQELKWHLYTENNFGHTLLSISASPKSWPGYIVITTTINTDVASFPVLIPQLLLLAVWVYSTTCIYCKWE